MALVTVGCPLCASVASCSALAPFPPAKQESEQCCSYDGYALDARHWCPPSHIRVSLCRQLVALGQITGATDPAKENGRFLLTWM
jgi:hypothetical protein